MDTLSSNKDQSTRPTVESPTAADPNQLQSARHGSAKRKGTPLLFGRLAGLLPAILVITVLGGLGWWGHRTGWQMPRFSTLTGTAVERPDDWCAEHNVPESQCVECNPERFPKPPAGQWCQEHGVHLCPLCTPEIAQLGEAPEIAEVDLQRARRALELRPRSENNPLCQLYRRRIQFASHEAALRAGVDVEPVSRATVVEAVEATGEIRYDPTRTARLSSKAPGTVWRVEKEIGDRVRENEVLALVDSAQVGDAKAKLLTALADLRFQLEDYQRLEGLEAKGIVPGKELLKVKTDLSRARTSVLQAQQSLINLGLPVRVHELKRLSETEAAARLQFLGLPERMTAEHRFLDREGLSPSTTSNLLPIVAPLAGVVVERQAVAGEVVDASRVLFEVADTSRMWLILNVPLEEVKHVEVGQRVQFHPDDGSEPVSGEVSWISTAADHKTRTVKVRADVPNSEGRLRDETFGSGRVVLREEPRAIVVPPRAVVWDGSCHIVFVRDKDYFEDGAPKVFHTRPVRVAAQTERHTEIIAGVLPGEVVATEGAEVLRSQLLKSNLGAG